MSHHASLDTRLLIVNADDLGICDSVNIAIREAHECGVLTSASIMATGPSFDHAIEQVVQSCPELGIGLHVNLTSGRCAAPPPDIPLLVDDAGRFRHGFVGLMRLLRKHRTDAVRQIDCEVRSQYERLRGAGVAIDHVNSHRHVHMIPPIFERLATFAGSERCAIRMSYEPLLAGILQRPRALSNLPKRCLLAALARQAERHCNGVARTDAAFGILTSGAVTESDFAVVAASGERSAELIVHPGGKDPQLSDELDAGDIRFHKSSARRRELEVLSQTLSRETLAIARVSLARFDDLTHPRPVSCELYQPSRGVGQ